MFCTRGRKIQSHWGDLSGIIKSSEEEIPARMHTSLDPGEILAATNIAKEFNVEVTVDHSFRSQMVDEKLAEANIPVIAEPLMIAKLSPMYRYIFR
jgi:hypothetical protein